MTDTTTNLGGRPEIGGKIGPVSYGPELLAAIDRTWPGVAASRSDWLRDIAAAELIRQAPDTISWPDMTAAGVDTDLVERYDPRNISAQWKATGADGLTRIVFGLELDPDGVMSDERGHKGWSAAWYDIEDDGEDDGDGPTESFRSNEYYEPYDLPRLLADVAKVASRGHAAILSR